MIGIGIRYTILTKRVWKTGDKYQLGIGTKKQIEHGWITVPQDFFDSVDMGDSIQLIVTKLIPEGDGG